VSVDNTLLFGALVFVGVVLLIEGAYGALRAVRQRGADRVRRRLRRFVEHHREHAAADITRQNLYSDVPWFNALLKRLAHGQQFTLLIEQANAPYTIGFYLLLTAFLGALGTTLAVVYRLGFPLGLVLSLAGAALPYLFLVVRKGQRMDAFQRQFPEGLELLARAMRAGNSFASALKMVADEFPDPIGPEFARVVEEINFGVALPDALANLAKRVESQELKFFIVAVIVQRETGGNLAEIVEKIGTLIRQRFVLRGKIVALSAEGKLSAIVLIFLPVLLALYFFIAQRDYIMTLVTDPAGRVMVAGALCLMALGVLVMNRMVQIKV
jgi:tight adherence protein B